MKYVDPNEGLKVFDIKFDITTAGPSPLDNNKRIELFLLGCDKAMCGHPCPGCFNKKLWDANLAQHSCDIESLANWIVSKTPIDERYITLGGAEPSMQIDKLIPFCKILKDNGFHIMMYTWRELNYELYEHTLPRAIDYPLDKIDKNKWYELFKYIDMVVDGQFLISQKLYQEDAQDGLLSSIGSGNQSIWDIKYYNKTHNHKHYYMKDIQKLRLTKFDNNLIFELKGELNESI
jgi:organic radical activating enzyme